MAEREREVIEMQTSEKPQVAFVVIRNYCEWAIYDRAGHMCVRERDSVCCRVYVWLFRRGNILWRCLQKFTLN